MFARRLLHHAGTQPASRRVPIFPTPASPTFGPSPPSSARRAPVSSALRVGAVNGDSRPQDRPRRRRFAPPDMVTGVLHPDAPSPSYNRTKAENRARTRYVTSSGPGRGPDARWAGDVSDSPAAHLLHVLRARWMRRAEAERTAFLYDRRPPRPVLSKTLREVYRRLVEEIRRCDNAYYGDNPTKRIRDEEYDELIMHLQELERIFPQLVTQDSPSQVVGHRAAVPPIGEILTPIASAGVLSQRFPPYRHAARMLSLANAYSPEDVEAFLLRAYKFDKTAQKDIAVRDAVLPVDSNVTDSHDDAATKLVLPCCVEVKVDGVALALSYRHGRLVAASTRGDGVIGDDVTENVRSSLLGRGVVEELPRPDNVEVRGEVYIRPDEFSQLKFEEKLNLSNARNAAAGGLKHKDPQETSKRMLRFIAYECLRVPDDIAEQLAESGELKRGVSGGVELPGELSLVADWPSKVNGGSDGKIHNFWPTQVETLEGLERWGMGAMSNFKLCRTTHEIQEYATDIEAMRRKLPFEADGVVIKVNDSLMREAMGNTAKAPRGSIAFKFAAVGAATKVTHVAMQVSRTGAVTPVAYLEPVQIGGVTLSRATLHNFDEIQRLDVAVNDTVVVHRGGDVIPKIVKVKTRAADGVRKAVAIPTECPSCGKALEVSIGTSLKCTTVVCKNRTACEAQGLGRIMHFASRSAMDIRGLGQKTVLKLIDNNLVTRPSDLFTLTVSDMLKVDGFAEKSASNLVGSIRSAATSRSLERLIIALGIPCVGQASARALAYKSETIDGLLQLSMAPDGKATLMHLPHIADKNASAIFEFLSDPGVVQELQLLRQGVQCSEVADGPIEESCLENGDFAKNEVGIDGEARATAVSPVQGRTFVFTGKMELLMRADAIKKIRERGGRVVSVVSKKTNFVIAGAEPGLKFHKAQRLGVRILAEDDLAKMLGEDPCPPKSSDEPGSPQSSFAGVA